MSDRPVTTVMPLPDYARVSREEKQLLVEKRGGVATSTNKQLIQQLEELDETAPIADLDLEDLSSQFTIPALKAILKANGQRFGSKDKKSILADLVIDLSNSSKTQRPLRVEVPAYPSKSRQWRDTQLISSDSAEDETLSPFLARRGDEPIPQVVRQASAQTGKLGSQEAKKPMLKDSRRASHDHGSRMTAARLDRNVDMGPKKPALRANQAISQNLSSKSFRRKSSTPTSPLADQKDLYNRAQAKITTAGEAHRGVPDPMARERSGRTRETAHGRPSKKLEAITDRRVEDRYYTTRDPSFVSQATDLEQAILISPKGAVFSSKDAVPRTGTRMELSKWSSISPHPKVQAPLPSPPTKRLPPPTSLDTKSRIPTLQPQLNASPTAEAVTSVNRSDPRKQQNWPDWSRAAHVRDPWSPSREQERVRVWTRLGWLHEARMHPDDIMLIIDVGIEGAAVFKTAPFSQLEEVHPLDAAELLGQLPRQQQKEDEAKHSATLLIGKRRAEVRFFVSDNPASHQRVRRYYCVRLHGTSHDQWLSRDTFEKILGKDAALTLPEIERRLTREHQINVDRVLWAFSHFRYLQRERRLSLEKYGELSRKEDIASTLLEQLGLTVGDTMAHEASSAPEDIGIAEKGSRGVKFVEEDLIS